MLIYEIFIWHFFDYISIFNLYFPISLIYLNVVFLVENLQYFSIRIQCYFYLSNISVIIYFYQYFRTFSPIMFWFSFIMIICCLIIPFRNFQDFFLPLFKIFNFLTFFLFHTIVCILYHIENYTHLIFVLFYSFLI